MDSLKPLKLQKWETQGIKIRCFRHQVLVKRAKP